MLMLRMVTGGRGVPASPGGMPPYGGGVPTNVGGWVQNDARIMRKRVYSVCVAHLSLEMTALFIYYECTVGIERARFNRPTRDPGRARGRINRGLEPRPLVGR